MFHKDPIKSCCLFTYNFKYDPSNDVVASEDFIEHTYCYYNDPMTKYVFPTNSGFHEYKWSSIFTTWFSFTNSNKKPTPSKYAMPTTNVGFRVFKYLI